MKSHKVRILIVISVVILGAVIWFNRDRFETEKRPLEKVTLGTIPGSILSSLIWIADKKKYFEQYGIDVEVKGYESGLQSFEAMLEGKVDFSTSAEIVAARYFARRKDFRIIAAIDEGEDIRIIGRRDHGINEKSDLKGKKVGLLGSSSAGFYLSRFMEFHNITPDNERPIDLSPSDQVKQLVNGQLDAIVVWEPFAAQACREMGNNASVWPAQCDQTYYWLLLSMNETIKQKPLLAQNLLKALIAAENFAEQNEMEAQSILSQYLMTSEVQPLWKNHIFRLVLSRPLILAMEAEAKWMKSANYGLWHEGIPDFNKMIYLDALKAVRPERVRIID